MDHSNWRGMMGHQAIVRLIGATTAESALNVCCEIDATDYPKGSGYPAPR